MDGHDGLKDAFKWAKNELGGSTVMTTDQIPCNGNVDMKAREIEPIPGAAGALGATECVDYADQAQNICNSANLTFDIANMSNNLSEPGDLTINMEKTSCHEIGHTVGFEHHPDSYYPPTGTHDKDCMRSWIINEASTWLRINGHHVNHINSYLS